MWVVERIYGGATTMKENVVSMLGASAVSHPHTLCAVLHVIIAFE